MSVKNPSTSKRFCFVAPRYFEGIAGGAETLLGALATQLARRGNSVELVTTCAKDNRSWNNELPSGEDTINGVRVRRFPVHERDLGAWIPVQCAIHEGRQISVDEQLLWLQESVNSGELYRYLHQNGDRFDVLLFGPYLFGTTFWGSMIHPHKSVLIPCLHDEAYAYLDCVASMFRNVRGCLFNAEPEMHLARSLYGDIPGAVVGMGFEAPSLARAEELEPYFDHQAPYILYVGRKEMGKNVHLLLDYFCEAKRDGLLPSEMRLVILGGGSFSDLHRDDLLDRDDIIDLPHLSERDKQRVVRHSLFLCQPSTNESFSIVIMEAWMVGTPVVVHGKCAVTRHHVVESHGGLYFSSPSDLAGVARHMLETPGARGMLARNGARYVATEYAWPRVLEKFDAAIESLFGATTDPAHRNGER
jgi:glycosyltransferase involved in cell wall biosynthesis